MASDDGAAAQLGRWARRWRWTRKARSTAVTLSDLGWSCCHRALPPGCNRHAAAYTAVDKVESEPAQARRGECRGRRRATDE
jgi:hypothetical protein